MAKADMNGAVIESIEKIFEHIADSLLNERHEISIPLKNRKSQAKNNVTHANGDAQSRSLCFPGKSAEEAWRFTVVLRILGFMHEALRNNIVMSKRDIFYRDPALFGTQAQVDRYVDDIAFTFGVSRSSLNVTAVAKGLVAGATTLCRRDGSTINAAVDREGILTPSLKDILSIDMSAVKWILVIEKEATFRSIASSRFWDRISTEGIILTGKGYPDLASRALLRLLSCPSPATRFASPPVFGLADYDPDGIAILSTYKHGSNSLAHENKNHQVLQLQWLGLCSEHLAPHEKDSQTSQGMLKLSARDRKKAICLLENEELPELWRQEIQRMLMLNIKAELQLLESSCDGMIGLLTSKLCI